MSTPQNKKIAIVGLGYVGLPLAIEFSKKYSVVGYDIDENRIAQLLEGTDNTNEADLAALLKATTAELPPLKLTANSTELKEANIFIITVPTPIDEFKNPDLSFLLDATKTIGTVLKKGDIVIYESTVYPGCTEEDCVPVLENISGLRYNIDFFVGYSPERVSPGDKVHTLTKILKVTSGSTPAIADDVDELYKSIIQAGTYKAASIKVAEAAKAIENAQRDVNISFVNELALIFDRMNIDTQDVLDAAATKWNFLPFKPGLVGGHCISVDPYYLAYKAAQLGYQPQVILSGRNVNDKMAAFIAAKVIKLMIKKGHSIKGAKALILGMTFKENCPDIRNTKVVDIYKELQQFGLDIDIFDPWAEVEEVKLRYGVNIIASLDNQTDYAAIIIAVAHEEFKTINYLEYKDKNAVIFDVKAFVDRNLVDERL